MNFGKSSRRSWRIDWGVTALGMLLLASGCRSINGTISPAQGPETPVSLQPPTAGSPTLAEWVSIAFGAVGDAGTEARVSAGTQGNESDFFMEVVGRLARETRDVGPVVRWAARNWVMRDDTAAAKVVTEVWARECCLRRSFVVEALDGVLSGMDGTESGGDIPVVDASTALKLAELSEHADAGVARAARALGRRFSMGIAPDDATSGRP